MYDIIMHVDDLTGVTSIRHTTVSYGKSEDQNAEIATKTPIDDTKITPTPSLHLPLKLWQGSVARISFFIFWHKKGEVPVPTLRTTETENKRDKIPLVERHLVSDCSNQAYRSKIFCC